MEPYKIVQSDRRKDGDPFPPPKPDDHSWHGVREFWARSYGGEHTSEYDAGVVLAKEDLDNDQTTNWDTIQAATVEERDKAWEAKRDGYNDTVLKAQHG